MSFHVANYRVEVPFLNVLIIVVFGVMAVISVLAMLRIIQRAGYSGWWVLIIFVPLVNMLALWYFGFRPWPAFVTSERAK